MSARCTPARADRRLVQLDYLAPAVERVHPREDLVLGHLTPHLEEDENVDVVRHAAIGEDLHAGEELDTHQKVDEPVLLLVVEEERLVRNPRYQVVALASLNDPFPPHYAAQATTSAAPKSSIYSQAYMEGSF